MRTLSTGTIIILAVVLAVIVFGRYGVGIRLGGDLLEFRPAGAPPMLDPEAHRAAPRNDSDSSMIDRLCVTEGRVRCRE